MPRPRDIGVIDLMLEIPAGGAVMSMEAARRLTRDKRRGSGPPQALLQVLC